MKKRMELMSEKHAAEVASMRGDVAAAHDRARRNFEKELAQKDDAIEELKSLLSNERQSKEDAEKAAYQDCEYKLYQARSEEEKKIADLQKTHEFKVMELRLQAQEAEVKAQAEASKAIEAAKKEFETR